MIKAFRAGWRRSKECRERHIRVKRVWWNAILTKVVGYLRGIHPDQLVFFPGDNFTVAEVELILAVLPIELGPTMVQRMRLTKVDS
jgi:hypothetical protein